MPFPCYSATGSATRIGPCNGRSSTTNMQSNEMARQIAAAMKTQ